MQHDESSGARPGDAPSAHTGARGADGDLAGHAPSNTCPAICKVLRFGVDSLYLTYSGELSEVWAGILDGKKEAARSDQDRDKAKAWFSILDHQFLVGPFGRNVFRYIVQDNAYRIELGGLRAKRVPLAYCKIDSTWLLHLGVDQAVSQLGLIVSTFGQVQGAPTVARVDLCADFVTDVDLDAIHRSAWVTRARDYSAHAVNLDYSGVSIGQGGFLSARLYDKTLEIEKSGKHYMRALWQQAGWLPDQRVYRLEFQFRREVLRELGVSTFAEMQSKRGGLWAYATHSWLRLTNPNQTDTTKSRWPTHPLWETLQAVPWDESGQAERVPARKDRVPSDERLANLYIAVLSSYMAAKGLRDPLEAAESLDAMARTELDSYTSVPGVRYEEIILDKAMRKATQFNQPMPGSTDGVREAKARAYRKATGRE
ncbi:MAG: replication initiation factor [Nevskia sp.]|nr:replication initiation factor [Nevskia sp.]